VSEVGRIGVTLPSRTAPLGTVADYSELADKAGFASIWTYELYRDPLQMLSNCATRTYQVQLGTGVAAAFSRSPFVLANAVADIDELSGGRMTVGLGTGVPELLQAFHSAPTEQPLRRMREYMQVLRCSWHYMITGEVEPFIGDFYRFEPPALNVFGLRPGGREQIPIYLAAMGPKMLQLVGERADGWIGYLASPKFLEQVVMPNISLGAQRAGRDVSEIDIAAELICSVSPDREVAMRRARIQVGTYLAHPVSDRVVALHGLQEAQLKLRMGLMSEGPTALERTDDRLVEAFSVCGTPDEARQRLDEYRTLPHKVLHTPYVPPLTAEESDDAYRNLIQTFAPNSDVHGEKS
jgi:probable F420-dependent oxidoreductase